MGYNSRDIADCFGKTIRTNNYGYRIDKEGVVYDLFSPNFEHGKLFRIAGIRKEDFEITEACTRFKRWRRGEYVFSESVKTHEIYLPILDGIIEKHGRAPEQGLLLIMGTTVQGRNGNKLWDYRAFSEITDIY